MFNFLFGFADEDFNRSNHQLVVGNKHAEDEETLACGEDDVKGDHHLVRALDGSVLLIEEFPAF